jgi:hypothetical protein
VTVLIKWKLSSRRGSFEAQFKKQHFSTELRKLVRKLYRMQIALRRDSKTGYRKTLKMDHSMRLHYFHTYTVRVEHRHCMNFLRPKGLYDALIIEHHTLRRVKWNHSLFLTASVFRVVPHVYNVTRTKHMPQIGQIRMPISQIGRTRGCITRIISYYVRSPVAEGLLGGCL